MGALFGAGAGTGILTRPKVCSSSRWEWCLAGALGGWLWAMNPVGIEGEIWHQRDFGILMLVYVAESFLCLDVLGVG